MDAGHRCSATRSARCALARSTTRWPRRRRADRTAVPRREHRAQRGLDRVHDQDPRRHLVPRRNAAQRRRRDGQHQPQLHRAAHRRCRQGHRPPTRPDPTPKIKFEKIDDFTFTIFTGFNGDPAQPIPWPLFPTYLTGSGRPDRLTDMARRGRRRHGRADRSRRHRPVHDLQSYAPGDRMVVTRNPDYWRTDENGNQLPVPRRDRVPGDRQDSQVRGQALESGDVDMIATSDAA